MWRNMLRVPSLPYHHFWKQQILFPGFNIIQEHNIMLYFWMSGSNHGVYAATLNPWKPALVTVNVFCVFMKVSDF